MKRVSAHVAAMSLVISLAGVLLSSITAYAEPKPDNPGNHYGKLNNPGNHFGQLFNPGHHYGQLKHQPGPTPAPSPNPTSNPTTNPGGAGSTSGQPAGGASDVDRTIGGTTSIEDLPIVVPPQNVPAGQISLQESASGDGLAWLVLIILPALLAVWLLVFARAALSASRQGRKSAALAVPSPSPSRTPA